MPELVTPLIESGATPYPEQLGFLNEKQLLMRIPICRRTLTTWKRKDIIPYVAVGGRVLYDWQSCRQALLRRQRGAE